MFLNILNLINKRLFFDQAAQLLCPVAVPELITLFDETQDNELVVNQQEIEERIHEDEHHA